MAITLGGQARELRYPWKSVTRLKAECGINLLDGKFDTADPATITGLLWAGLIADQPDLTRDQVMDWITLRELGAIESAMADAIRLAIEGEPAPNP